ncbi:transposase, partial [Mycobacterium tuberculosis UT0124]
MTRVGVISDEFW